MAIRANFNYKISHFGSEIFSNLRKVFVYKNANSLFYFRLLINSLTSSLCVKREDSWSEDSPFLELHCKTRERERENEFLLREFSDGTMETLLDH